jgi:hypothetical protein
VCNICRQFEYKQESIDWVARKTMREALVEVVGTDDYRVKKWDELVTALR